MRELFLRASSVATLVPSLEARLLRGRGEYIPIAGIA